MRRLLLDTNVVLDILLDRKPHAAVASAVWAALEKAHGKGLLAAHAATTIHYLIQKDRGTEVARQALEAVMLVLEIAAVDGATYPGGVGPEMARLRGRSYRLFSPRRRLRRHREPRSKQFPWIAGAGHHPRDGAAWLATD